jgi:hypothetical protein
VLSFIFKNVFVIAKCFTFLLLAYKITFLYHHQLAQSKDKEEFECPTNVGNGNFADPVTCRRFYQVTSYLN